jgi:DNA-binding XRE family transcriptional regulator
MDQVEELLNEFRAWVRERRGNQDLARRALGLSKQTISGWVTGDARPSLESGLKLQAFLKAQRIARAAK